VRLNILASSGQARIREFQLLSQRTKSAKTN
jgi:hypothetical protein